MDKRQKMAIVLMPLLALFLLVACGKAVNQDTPADAGYTNGVYEGVAAGFNGDIKVSVTIADGKISGIELVEINDTAGLGDTAANTVIEAVLAAQSTEVETVSGATLSSQGTIDAINAALAKASGGGAFTDGTYEGTAAGFGGDLTAKVTVSGGKITAIDFVAISETAGLGDTAAQTVADAIIAAQGFEVETVSGATASSNATIAAVQNALGLGEEPVAETPAPVEIDLASLADGAYTAAEEGFKSDIELSVVVEGGVITRIDIVSQDDTPGIGDTAIQAVIDQVVSTQNIQADVVSGATYSSQAAIKAIETALQGTPGPIVVAEAPAEEPAEEPTEAPAKEEPATPTTPTTPTPAPEPPAPAPAPEPAAPAFKDGSHTATSNNSFYGDPISVTITVSGGKITNVTVKENETPEFGGEAAKKIAAAIVSKQSADVDTISGATITSEGVIEAAKAALAKAK